MRKSAGVVLAEDGHVTVRGTPLSGLLLISPKVFSDVRGFFLESYRKETFARLGVDADLVQDNHSRSVKDTVRALHFQLPPGQGKLVRCARGTIWDVAVDLRRSSATFGQWWGVEISDENHLQLWLPRGLAHGFCVTSEVADVVYRCDAYYDSAVERGIAWDSPELAIEWPTKTPLLSDRDKRHPTFAQYPGPFFP